MEGGTGDAVAGGVCEGSVASRRCQRSSSGGLSEQVSIYSPQYLLTCLCHMCSLTSVRHAGVELILDIDLHLKQPKNISL